MGAVMDNSLSCWELTKMLPPSVFLLSIARHLRVEPSCLSPPWKRYASVPCMGDWGVPWTLTWTFSISLYSSSARSACVPVCDCAIQNVY
jgi:hypothetical protein